MSKTGISFSECMAMMRKNDPQTQEDGFHALAPRAGEFVQELIEAFRAEKGHGLRCWLLELIGMAKSEQALPLLAEYFAGPDKAIRQWADWGLRELDTKEARRILWQARLQ